MKVAIYIRESGTRQYKPASPRAMYPSSLTFCLRYTLGGKRRWEQLSVSTYKEAQAVALKRLSDLITEVCTKDSLGAKLSSNLNLPVPRRRPEPKPVVKTGELMLDAAIDKYLENIATKSSKTSHGYRYTLQQFYASAGNLVLSQVTTQQLYDFVAYLRREGLGDRTIHNRVGEVVTFLRHFGIKDVTLRRRKIRRWQLHHIFSQRPINCLQLPPGCLECLLRCVKPLGGVLEVLDTLLRVTNQRDIMWHRAYRHNDVLRHLAP